MMASPGTGEKNGERDKILREIESMALRGNREIRGLLGESDGGPVEWRAFLAELRRCLIPVNEAAGIATRWETAGEIPDGPISEISAGASLAKVVREAVHNMVKHSGARAAENPFRIRAGPPRPAHRGRWPGIFRNSRRRPGSAQHGDALRKSGWKIFPGSGRRRHQPANQCAAAACALKRFWKKGGDRILTFAFVQEK